MKGAVGAPMEHFLSLLLPQQLSLFTLLAAAFAALSDNLVSLMNGAEVLVILPSEPKKHHEGGGDREKQDDLGVGHRTPEHSEASVPIMTSSKRWVDAGSIQPCRWGGCSGPGS